MEIPRMSALGGQEVSQAVTPISSSCLRCSRWISGPRWVASAPLARRMATACSTSARFGLLAYPISTSDEARLVLRGVALITGVSSAAEAEVVAVAPAVALPGRVQEDRATPTMSNRTVGRPRRRALDMANTRLGINQPISVIIADPSRFCRHCAKGTDAACKGPRLRQPGEAADGHEDAERQQHHVRRHVPRLVLAGVYVARQHHEHRQPHGGERRQN